MRRAVVYLVGLVVALVGFVAYSRGLDEGTFLSLFGAAVAVVGFFDLMITSLIRHRWIIVWLMAAGALAGVWWVEAVGEICTTRRSDSGSCGEFLWPEAILVPVMGAVTLGLVGYWITKLRSRLSKDEETDANKKSPGPTDSMAWLWTYVIVFAVVGAMTLLELTMACTPEGLGPPATCRVQFATADVWSAAAVWLATSGLVAFAGTTVALARHRRPTPLSIAVWASSGLLAVALVTALHLVGYPSLPLLALSVLATIVVIPAGLSVTRPSTVHDSPVRSADIGGRGAIPH